MDNSFAKGSIEFLTVAIEFCRFIEQAATEVPVIFVDHTVKLLALLYQKASLVEPTVDPDTVDTEHSVDEPTYNAIRASLKQIFGRYDQYLTAAHPDIALTDNVVAASVSEDIADIYQSVKDFTVLAQLGDKQLMNEALSVCIDDFGHYWGERLLSALLALHTTIHSDTYLSDDDL